MKTIYLNGTIRTMAGSETAEALLEENGRILQTGAPPTCSALALRHGASICRGTRCCRVSSTATAISQRSRRRFCSATCTGKVLFRNRRTAAGLCAARRTAPGEWVMGFGYDPTALAENAHRPPNFSTALPKILRCSRTPRGHGRSEFSRHAGARRHARQ